MKYIKISKLLIGTHQKGGRSKGEITAPRRGALTKRSYRYLDTKRRLWSQEGAAIIMQYIYDPYRTAHISLIMLPNGVVTYILAGQYSPNQQKVFNIYPQILVENGSSKKVGEIKNGNFIFNCELRANTGAQLLRSAGVAGVVLKKEWKMSTIKLKSGALRRIPSIALAASGFTSNPNHFIKKLRKAGENRNRGWRPRTRPSAMNPVDHPMGGRTKGGIHPQNKNGIRTGTPTVGKKKRHKLELSTSRKFKLKKKE